jgi:hypothetical protein
MEVVKVLLRIGSMRRHLDVEHIMLAVHKPTIQQKPSTHNN